MQANCLQFMEFVAAKIDSKTCRNFDLPLNDVQKLAAVFKTVASFKNGLSQL